MASGLHDLVSGVVNIGAFMYLNGNHDIWPKLIDPASDILHVKQLRQALNQVIQNLHKYSMTSDTDTCDAILLVSDTQHIHIQQQRVHERGHNMQHFFLLACMHTYEVTMPHLQLIHQNQ